MNESRTRLLGLGLVIFAATFCLYRPSLDGEFLRGDDWENLHQAIRWDGLSWGAVHWAFTSAQPYYQPLARLSRSLDYQLWRKKAAGHHLTNVVLHAVNAVLVFGLAWTLLGATSLTTDERLATACGVSVVFAVHPLQVETVAWISGRTHLLCATFGIGSVWAYVAGARRWLVWALYAGAVVSQPIAVSLPLTMLAIDYFPLRRHQEAGWRQLLIEKIPLLGLGILVVAATMITGWRFAGPMVPMKAFPATQRVLLMFENLAFYPAKLLWPAHLSPFYPLPSGLSLEQWPILLSVLSVGTIAFVAVWRWRRTPALVVGCAAYAMMILPVSGPMQGGSQAMAPRYAYQAMLPLLLLAGGAAVWLWRHSANGARAALVGLLVVAVCGFGRLTHRMILVWHDDETLWRAVLAEFPDWELPNGLVVMSLVDQGRGREALDCAERYVKIAPGQRAAHNALGLVMSQLGGFEAAVRQYERALQIDPGNAEVHFNLATVLARLGQTENADGEYVEALRIRPDYLEAHLGFGSALLRQGRVPEAMGHFQEALRINPDYAGTYFYFGNALLMQNRAPEAIERYEKALRVDPEYAPAQWGFGNALALENRASEAIPHYEEALRLDPEYAEAHYNLGLVLAGLGRMPEAMAHWEQVLRIHPDDIQAHYSLGTALEQQGRMPEAIEQYKRVLQLQPDFTAASNALVRLQGRQ